MKISIQIIVDYENGAPAMTKSITEFKRKDLSVDTLGLTLEESKLLLKDIQFEFVQQQVSQYIYKNKTCDQCKKDFKIKGHTEIIYRTLFGKLKLPNPRLYKCSCSRNKKQKSFSLLSSLFPERIFPELQYLQTKWASLVSYGVTSNILEEILPMHVNISGIYYTTHKIAKRLDLEIEEEQHCYIKGCENEWNKLPLPDSPLTVGIDGGYIHAREGKNRKAGWFEAIVGKSLHETKPSKRFGFVCKYDNKPKSRINTMLQKQNFQMNQDIVFLSDGGDTVSDLQQYIAPHSEHLLDWFHITMKIIVMKQIAVGLQCTSKDKLYKQLDSIKWNLWHGNVDKALDKIDSFSEDFYEEEIDKNTEQPSIINRGVINWSQFEIDQPQPFHLPALLYTFVSIHP